jgi:D-amino-acid dehydrogenase
MRVVVVGAGIVGASVAYHLARRGMDVLVVDSADDGGATAAGAGIVGPWLSAERDPDWYRLASAGARYYPRLVELLAADGETELGYARVGGLVVHPDPGRLDPSFELLSARQAALPGDIGTVERLPPAETRLRFPPLAPDLHGIHVSGVSRVDGRLVRTALLRAAARHGAARRAGSAALTPGGVLVDGAPEPADAVVVAAGAWSAHLVAPLGPRLAVAAQRGQIVHLQLSDADTAGWPVVQPVGRQYLLAFPGGRIVVGATREDGSGLDYRVTAAGQATVLAEALAIAPGLSDATVLETRVGFRPVTPDGLPLLGAVPGAGRLIVATGMGPTGLTMGPYAGELAARLALGEDPGFDLSRYLPTRGTTLATG